MPQTILCESCGGEPVVAFEPLSAEKTVLPAGAVRTGDRVDWLTVVSPAISRRGRRWIVRCDCGAEKIVTDRNLRTTTRSCGCFRRVCRARLRHGHTRQGADGRVIASPTYRSWRAMIQRCTDPGHTDYAYYGGRGVRVCDRWLGADGFAQFLADMGERPEGLTIDRVDNAGNYEPGNCRWATRSQQTLNQSPRKRRPDGTYAAKEVA